MGNRAAMTPERWQQVKEIFDSAMQREPEQRAVFLSSACHGDESLLREVQSLIVSHEKKGAFMDAPAYEIAAELLTNERLQLSPGQEVGAYEVIAFISRGGMGEVYLGQDRRLSRKVALKLLPSSFTRDADRLARFEQEARAASALNHPNILTIYEIRETDSTHMIVSEYVEGITLRQRLGESPLTLGEALHIAIQTADALAAAHRAGIIHRDIKPENIMLRPDGYVKVLDFGLAKLAVSTSLQAGGEAPTEQVRTASGMVMGTIGYMSPEQARGLTVDARSDIFSLGAIIYEMVARRKPFDGETSSDILAAILKTEPRRLSFFAPEAPAELVRIVTKALRKDPEERYQVIKDLLIDLRTLKQEMEFQAKLEQSDVPDRDPGSMVMAGGSPAGATREEGARTDEIKDKAGLLREPSRMAFRQFGASAWIGAGALILAAIAGGFWLHAFLSRSPPLGHFQTMEITRVTNSGKAIDATLSPDGRYLVYALSDAGKQSLWIRQVSTANDKEILPPANVGFFGLAFSRDGNDLYYAVKQNLDAGTLYRMPMLGGTPVKLLERIDGPVSFSPDGKRMVLLRGNHPAPGESALVIANSDGSNEHNLAVRKAPEAFSPVFFGGPAWSPDGKLVAAAVASFGSGSHVVAINVQNGKERILTARAWAFAARVEWLPDMKGLLVIAGETAGMAQVWYLPYPEGEARKITNDLATYRTVALTADGRKFSTIQAGGLVNIWVAPAGDAKQAKRLSTGNVGFYGPSGNNISWTPDDRIVFASNESSNPDIWIMDPDGGNRKQLTANTGQNLCPAVSPDGRYIVFTSTRGGTPNIWRIDIDGNNAKRLTGGLADLQPVVSPDGQWVVYYSFTAEKRTLWRVPIEGGKALELSGRWAISPSISPDGKFIAYLYPHSADPFAPPNRIAVIPFEGGEPVKTFSFQGSGIIRTVAQWSPDGRSLLYNVSINNVTNLWSQPLDGSPPRQVTDFKDALMTGFAWSRDGSQLVCSRGVVQRDAVLITDVTK